MLRITTDFVSDSTRKRGYVDVAGVVVVAEWAFIVENRSWALPAQRRAAHGRPAGMSL